MLVGPSASYHWLEGTHCLLLRPPSNLCLNLFIAWWADSPKVLSLVYGISWGTQFE